MVLCAGSDFSYGICGGAPGTKTMSLIQGVSHQRSVIMLFCDLLSLEKVTEGGIHLKLGVKEA